MHVELVLNFIARRQKIREAKSCVVAYRLSAENADNDLSRDKDGSQRGDGLMEGFDDSNEEGCGEKLLSQL